MPDLKSLLKDAVSKQQQIQQAAKDTAEKIRKEEEARQAREALERYASGR